MSCDLIFEISDANIETFRTQRIIKSFVLMINTQNNEWHYESSIVRLDRKINDLKLAFCDFSFRFLVTYFVFITTIARFTQHQRRTIIDVESHLRSP